MLDLREDIVRLKANMNLDFLDIIITKCAKPGDISTQI
jgi:hypothetical protein